LKTIRIVYQ